MTMNDFSVNVGGDNKGAIAGGVGTKATYNPKDNTKLYLYLIVSITIVISVAILAYTGQLDKAPFIGEGIAKIFGRI